MGSEKQEIRNAIITSASLGTENHGVLSVMLDLDYGGTCQGFGGWCLHHPSKDDIRSVAGHFIYRVLQIAGVRNWDDVKGKTIRVKWSPTRVGAIGHIVKDDWFDPEEDFRPLRGVEE